MIGNRVKETSHWVVKGPLPQWVLFIYAHHHYLSFSHHPLISFSIFGPKVCDLDVLFAFTFDQSHGNRLSFHNFTIEQIIQILNKALTTDDFPGQNRNGKTFTLQQLRNEYYRRKRDNESIGNLFLQVLEKKSNPLAGQKQTLACCLMYWSMIDTFDSFMPLWSNSSVFLNVMMGDYSTRSTNYSLMNWVGKEHYL